MLVGKEGANAFPSFWSCAVENPDSDIVIIDPAAPNYDAIKALVCKDNGYDVKITEVNPVGNGNWNAFVEVLNRGAQASISACLGNACSSAVSVPTGSYLVAHTSGGSGYGSYPTTLPTQSPSVMYCINDILI